MHVPIPGCMTLDEWVSAATQVLSQYVIVPQMNDCDWRSWGMLFFLVPGLGKLNPPNPHDFDDWVPWAERLSLTLNNADSNLSNTSLAGGSFVVTQSLNYLITQSGNYLITQING